MKHTFHKGHWDELTHRYSNQQIIESMNHRMDKLNYNIRKAKGLDEYPGGHENLANIIYQYLKNNIMIFDVMAYSYSDSSVIRLNAVKLIDTVFTACNGVILNEFDSIEDRSIVKRDVQTFKVIINLRDYNWIDVLNKYGFSYNAFKDTNKDNHPPLNNFIKYLASDRLVNFATDCSATECLNGVIKKEDNFTCTTILGYIATLMKNAPDRIRTKLLGNSTSKVNLLDTYMHSYDDNPNSITFDDNGFHQAFEVWLENQADINIFSTTRDLIMHQMM